MLEFPDTIDINTNNIKTISASDNMDDMEDNDFDLDHPNLPGHGSNDLDHDHANDPRCRPIDSKTLQHSMLMQVAPGYYRLACYAQENVAISTSTIISEDNGTMLGLFCVGEGHYSPAASRGDVQRKARLPSKKKLCFEMDSLICTYSSVRYNKGVLKTTFLDNNDYVWSNCNETVVLDASALTSGHGGKANDAFDDTKNNAVIIWINGEGWLVATRAIYFYEEICAAYGWVYWKDHPNLILREKARLYYESIQFEQAQQDQEVRLSTAQMKRIQLARRAQTVVQSETEPLRQITKKRIRKTEGIVTPVLPSHVLSVNKEAGRRHKKTQRSSMNVFSLL